MKTNVLILILLCALSPQPLRADVTDGLVGWWKMDEAAGNALDSSGQGNTLVPSGTTILTTGCKKINCRSLNGTTDYLSTASAIPALNSGNMTLCTWIYPGNLTGYKWLLHQWSVGSGGSGPAFFSNNNDIVFELGTYGVNNLDTTSSPLVLNKWQHVCAMASGTTFSIYYNGVFNISGVRARVESTATSFAAGGPSGLGSLNSFNGYMDDVRVYNRALSSNEVMAIYQAGTPHVSVKGGGKISGMKVQ